MARPRADGLGAVKSCGSQYRVQRKDLRRRWPEAIPWMRAYPLLAGSIAAALWMAVVVPLLDRFIGQ